MDILKDKKKVGEIPTERLIKIGTVADIRPVYRDKKTGKRYVSVTGYNGVMYVSRKDLESWFNFAL